MIGKRIKKLRNLLGLSQEDLGKKLEIDHSAISEIENNKRELKTKLILNLSKIFNITTDQLLGIEPIEEVILNQKKMKLKKTKTYRISVPAKNLHKFKEVLLYILNKVGAKYNIGESVIYKFLYFIDFNYYERYEEQFIGATYIKNHYGPTPIEFPKIVSHMIKKGELEKVKSKYFQYEQKKYLPHRKPDLSILTAQEIKTIDDVLNKLSNMNASAISDYSHNDVPWLVTPSGKKIDYETVFYRTPAYSMKNNENC